VTETPPIALFGDPGPLGQHFVEQLPKALITAADDFGKLSYPITDRLNLQDQLRDRRIEANRAVMSIPFPVLSLADALDKLFAARSGNLMQLAVGDYEQTMTRMLGRALSVGAIQVDEYARDLRVLTRPNSQGVSVDVDCICFTKGTGGCGLTIDESTATITCSGSCTNCQMWVTIPTAGLLALA
jgi:hypothetical protein